LLSADVLFDGFDRASGSVGGFGGRGGNDHPPPAAHAGQHAWGFTEL